MSWTNEIVLEFVDLYRTEEILWNSKHPLHRNTSEVTEAWIRIQNALSINCSVDCLKKKKESLMTAFRMHCKRRRSQPSYRTNWFAYDLMESFLASKYEFSSSNPIESEISYSSLNNNMSTEPDYKPFERNSFVSRQHDADNKYRKSEIVFPRKQINEATSSKRPTAEKSDVDEYELYGQLLVKKLKKLDERQRYVVMHEIDSIMFRAKMQSLQGDALTSKKIQSPVFVSLDDQHSQPQYDPASIDYEEQS